MSKALTLELGSNRKCKADSSLKVQIPRKSGEPKKTTKNKTKQG